MSSVYAFPDVLVADVPLVHPGEGLSKSECGDKTVMKILGINEGDDLPEMKIIGDDKKLYGGARGIVFLSKKIWWAWPLWALAHLPVTMSILDYIYKWIAKNRHRAVICEI